MHRSSRRGPWLPDEDKALLHLVQAQGANNWVRISQQLQHRSPKQCRERYHQNLKPSLKHEPITAHEGEVIEQMVAELGKRWAEIARHLGNRSDNAVKNWWNGSMNRRRRNPTHAGTGCKQVGSRIHPIPFTQAVKSNSGSERNSYSPQSLSAAHYDQWLSRSTESLRSYPSGRISTSQKSYDSQEYERRRPSFSYAQSTPQLTQQKQEIQTPKESIIRPHWRTSAVESRSDLASIHTDHSLENTDQRRGIIGRSTDHSYISPVHGKAIQTLQRLPPLITDYKTPGETSHNAATPSYPVAISCGPAHDTWSASVVRSRGPFYQAERAKIRQTHSDSPPPFTETQQKTWTGALTHLKDTRMNVSSLLD